MLLDLLGTSDKCVTYDVDLSYIKICDQIHGGLGVYFRQVPNASLILANRFHTAVHKLVVLVKRALLLA